MCVYSMVVDFYHDKWRETWEEWKRQQYPPKPLIFPSQPVISPKEVQDFKELLEKAKEYDSKTGQKECELESKKERLRKLAEELGVKLVFPKEKDKKIVKKKKKMKSGAKYV